MRWPKGTVAVQPWLQEQGIPRQLADRYCRSKWIETYLPIQPREESLRAISDALGRIKKSVEKAHRDLNVHESKTEGLVLKLVVRSSITDLKIEPNTVIRGALDGVVMRDLFDVMRILDGPGLTPAVKSSSPSCGKSSDCEP